MFFTSLALFYGFRLLFSKYLVLTIVIVILYSLLDCYCAVISSIQGMFLLGVMYVFPSVRKCSIFLVKQLFQYQIICASLSCACISFAGKKFCIWTLSDVLHLCELFIAAVSSFLCHYSLLVLVKFLGLLYSYFNQITLISYCLSFVRISDQNFYYNVSSSFLFVIFLYSCYFFSFIVLLELRFLGPLFSDKFFLSQFDSVFNFSFPRSISFLCFVLRRFGFSNQDTLYGCYCSIG